MIRSFVCSLCHDTKYNNDSRQNIIEEMLGYTECSPVKPFRSKLPLSTDHIIYGLSIWTIFVFIL